MKKNLEIIEIRKVTKKIDEKLDKKDKETGD